MGLNTERILQERLDKEQELNQRVRSMNKQIHQLEEELEQTNSVAHNRADEIMNLKKSQKKMQKLLEDLEDNLGESESKNQDLVCKLEEVQADAKESDLMHQMMLREH